MRWHLTCVYEDIDTCERFSDIDCVNALRIDEITDYIKVIADDTDHEKTHVVFHIANF